MCGISGALVRDRDKGILASIVESMGRTLIHRGPDNFSIAVKGPAAFAHNRLSILDLSPAGHQPYQNDRFVLAYNGEIYNYLELRKKLSSEGAVFNSSSDTAVLFEHLVRYGVPETLRSIRGMFAFVFYDSVEDVLYLCRDRFGIKPLVWMHSCNRVHWASEVKAIWRAADVRVDPVRTLFAAAGVGDHSGHYTVFEGVEQVPPGHYIEIRKDSPPRYCEYYNLLDEVQADYYLELDRLPRSQVHSLFLALLTESIRKMLMSDAPMGVFVSGGLDSGLVAAIAARMLPDLGLFTANIVGRHSEVEDARLLSRSLGAELHEAEFLPETMLSLWSTATYHYECPIVTHTNSIPFAWVANLARRSGVKAVLTGEGSDELFMGYPKLLADRYRRIGAAPVEMIKRLYGVVPGLKSYLFPEAAAGVPAFLELVVQGFERQRLRDQCAEAYAFLPSRQAIAEHSRTALMFREGLLALLHRNDRMGMINSIESRFPFLDEDLVRFALNLPMRYKIAWTRRFHDWKHPFLTDKAIVRRSAEAVLPKAIALKRKEGFPMYGHKNVRVKPGYFCGGYVEQLCGLTAKAQEHLVAKCDPYFVAKLVSVDVFGRLFDWCETPDCITQHLWTFTSMTYDGPAPPPAPTRQSGAIGRR